MTKVILQLSTMRLLLGFPQICKLDAEPHAFGRRSPIMSGSDAFNVPTGSSFDAIHHLWKHTFRLSQQDETAEDWACSDPSLQWSIPLDKLFQAKLRLTPRRLSGVYFQASEPGLVSAIGQPRVTTSKLCSGRTLKDPGASYEVLGGEGIDSPGP